MKKLLLAAWLILCGFSTSLNAQSSQFPHKVPFVMPEGTTTDDYTKGVINLRIAPEYRQYCGTNSLNIPGMDQYLDLLQVSAVEKYFIGSKPPSEPLNEFGLRNVDLSLIYTIRFENAIDMEKAVNFIQRHPAVLWAEPNFHFSLLYTPNDPQVPNQWYLDSLKVKDAWDVTHGDSTCVIGIIDTGISFTHPDFPANKHFYNMGDTIDGIDNDNDGYVDNYMGWDFGGEILGGCCGDNDPTFYPGGPAMDHGVLISGSILAQPDNNNCVAGIAWNCKMMGVKAVMSNTTFIGKGYAGIVYAADHGASYINCSWGGGYDTHIGRDAVNYATVNKGVVVAAAAGNTPVQNFRLYPSSYHNVVSVGGTETGNNFWFDNNNYGSSFNYLVDVAAPAGGVQTTKWLTACGSFSGTSMASPFVCGIAGLVEDVRPDLSPRQIQEVIRVTADDLYAFNGSQYTDRMGHGQVNAYRAVTDSNLQSMRVIDYEYDDDDGVLMAGDTIDLRVLFLNYLDPINNVTVTLTTPNTSDIEILHGTIDLGSSGTLDTVSTRLCPFRIVLKSSIQTNFRGYLKFEYNGDNYTDWEYIEINAQPSYVRIDENLVETGLNSTGNFGQLNGGISYPGWNQDEVGSFVAEAGFVLGTGPANVSNNITNNFGSLDTDWSAQMTAYREVPGQLADLEAHAKFNDSGAGAAALGVTVDNHVYQFSSEKDEDYVIFQYVLTNDSPNDTLKGAYGGLYMDWDAGWYDNNNAIYDPAARQVRLYEEYDTPWDWLMARPLTDDSMHAYVADVNTFSFTMADKWTAMTSNPNQVNGSDTSNIMLFLTLGPFDIPPGESHTLAFVVGGDRDSVKAASAMEAAEQTYACVIEGGMNPLPDLGPDIMDCDGISVYMLDPGSGYSSYAWSTGDSTQTISVNSSGTYSVTVSDGTCEAHDRIEVVVNEGINGGFTCAPTTVFVNDTVWFSDTTSNAIEWCWDFGDGSNECPIFPDIYHVYDTYGSYTVTMYVGNGVCIDTVTKILLVDTMVGITESTLLKQLRFYPNPAENVVTVEFEAPGSGAVQLRLRNMLGQVLLQTQGRKDGVLYRESIDLSGLPAGVYMGEVEYQGQRKVKKIIIR